VPYIAFVPMATAASGRDADAYLELADILGADLSGCELVVLSSCASGAPYVEGHVASPSLGDAFVDAGARAVVGTFWSVRDDAAARVMREFARAYRGRGADAVTALCAARRRLLEEGVSPHEWAAYAITLGEL
jgi:CHAT domain-containing protein